MDNSFEAIRTEIDRCLEKAASDRHSPMHTPVVATADADARVMVLRAWDAESRTLRFHTDVRAPKVTVIEHDPRIAVLAYDKEAKLQLRMRGTGRIERQGPIADAAWQSADNFARRCYLGEGPGAVADEPTSGLPPEFEGVEPSDAELIPARKNFAVLLVEVEAFDWFHLAHTGHRRALFDGEGARWIAP